MPCSIRKSPPDCPSSRSPLAYKREPNPKRRNVHLSNYASISSSTLRARFDVLTGEEPRWTPCWMGKDDDWLPSLSIPGGDRRGRLQGPGSKCQRKHRYVMPMTRFGVPSRYQRGNKSNTMSEMNGKTTRGFTLRLTPRHIPPTRTVSIHAISQNGEKGGKRQPTSHFLFDGDPSQHLPSQLSRQPPKSRLD